MFLASRCINISGKRLVDMKINANILFFNDTKLNDMIKIDFYRVYYIFISPRQHNQLLSTPDYCLFLAKVEYALTSIHLRFGINSRHGHKTLHVKSRS